MSQLIKAQPKLPIAAYTRKLLNTVLPGDSEFTAFVIDYYPEIAKKFGSAQNKLEKTNLLLLSENPFEICQRLQEAFPARYEQIEDSQIQKQIVRTMAFAINADEKDTWTLRFSGELGDLSWDDIQKIITYLKNITGAESQLMLTEVNPGSIELVIISTKEEFKKVKSKLGKTNRIGTLSILTMEVVRYKTSLWNRLFGYNSERVRDDALVDAYFLQSYSNSRQTNIATKLQIQRIEQNFEKLSTQYSLEKSQRYSIERVIYNVAVLGLSGTGKSSIIRKIVEPRLVDITEVRATQFDKHDRTIVVYHDESRHLLEEHTLTFNEWGGELIYDSIAAITKSAQDAKIMQGPSQSRPIGPHGFRAILLVTDVGYFEHARKGQKYSAERIKDHLKTFNDTFIRILLNEDVSHYLEMVILFVNKSDLLVGEYKEVLSMMKALYAPLEDSIVRKSQTFQFHIIVGSAQTDMGLVQLTSRLAEMIPPS